MADFGKFNPTELNNIKTKMTTDLSELEGVITSFNNLVDENINNPKVWDAESSNKWLNGGGSGDTSEGWLAFASADFPQYKQNFQDAIDVNVGAISA